MPSMTTRTQAANPLRELSRFGQSPWFDNLSRGLIGSGELSRLVREEGLKGVTSNPTIFEKAVSGGSEYDARIARLLADGVSGPERLFEALAVEDIRDAADALAPVFRESGGADGFVSLEVSPRLARDPEGTVAAARRLFALVGRPNVMIKIPGTAEGLDAVERALGAGVPVNVTLIFSRRRYEAVMHAHLRGLERLAAAGGSLPAAASVASFFVSRIDAAVDKLVQDPGLRGVAAVANAKLAYRDFRRVFSGERFGALARRGGRVQRLLWASTGVKNPAYGDLLYVESLIGPDTVNTLPPDTWKAFLDHGRPRASVEQGLEEAERLMERLAAAGVDLERACDGLEEAGVKAFADSYAALLRVVEEKAGRLRAPA